MGYYRPRPTEVKRCQNCHLLFETNHKRTIYCGSSCRTLAYNTRHSHKTSKTKMAKGDLNFSIQNVGVTAVGAGVVALGNYWLNDQPTQQQILTTIAQLDKDIEKGLNQLNQGTQYLVDGINALKVVNPLMHSEMNRIQEERLIEQAKAEGRRDIIQRIMNNRKLKEQAQINAGR